MSEKFDEFSKHLATRKSRRGALKFLGGGLVGAFFATVFTHEADADGWRRRKVFQFFNGHTPNFNYTLPDFNYTLPDFNKTLPYINDKLPNFNQTLPKDGIHEIHPYFNRTRPYFNYSNPRFNQTVLPILRRFRF